MKPKSFHQSGRGRKVCKKEKQHEIKSWFSDRLSKYLQWAVLHQQKYKQCYYYYYYHCPSPLPGYGPLKLDLQRFLSWTILSSWLKAYPSFGNSYWRLNFGPEAEQLLILLWDRTAERRQEECGGWRVVKHYLCTKCVACLSWWAILAPRLLIYFLFVCFLSKSHKKTSN